VPNRARLSIAISLIPAMALAGCNSREAELAERNAQLQQSARQHQAEADTELAFEQEKRQIAREKRKKALSSFYGKDSDTVEESDEDEDAADSQDEADETHSGSWDDPTSDYFDNTYAAPETADAGAGGGETGDGEAADDA
jgi:hypothetical protein